MSIFLRGSGADVGTRIALDAADDVWVAGTTRSADFPQTSGFLGGGEFVVEFNPAGSALAYAARFPVGTAQAGLAVDAAAVLHLAGATGLVSTLTPGSSNARLFGVSNAAAGPMAGRVAPAEVISIGIMLSWAIRGMTKCCVNRQSLPTRICRPA
jgi:hypothetical protein